MSDNVVAAAPLDGQRFTIGRTLSLSFGVFGRNLGPMTLLAVAILGVEAAIRYAISRAGSAASAGSTLGLVSYALITAPVTYATFRDLRGTGARTGDLFQRGFNRVGRVFGVTFVMTLVIAVPAILVLGVGGLGGISMAWPFAVVGVFALYIFVVWFVVVPVQVVEEVKFFRGFGRAAALGRGRRWTLLGLLLIYFAMVAAIFSAMAAVVYLGPDSELFITILAVPFGALYSIFGAILPAVTYYLLRAEKEGIGINQIAQVFD